MFGVLRELHEAELRQEFGASELRLESFCQKPLGLQTKLGIAVIRERARLWILAKNELSLRGGQQLARRGNPANRYFI